MKIDLGTLDLAAVISSIISTIVILCALLWAILSPGCEEKKRKKKEASFLRTSIRLYLDVINDKLNQSPPSFYLEKVAKQNHGPSFRRFETVTKQNHDALEQFFLGSDLLEFEEREKLRQFVRFFKALPEITKEEQLKKYKTKLEDLMKMFPEKPK